MSPVLGIINIVISSKAFIIKIILSTNVASNPLFLYTKQLFTSIKLIYRTGTETFLE